MSDTEGGGAEQDVDKLFESSDDEDAEAAPSQPADNRDGTPLPGARATSPEAQDLEEAAMRAPGGEAPVRRYESGSGEGEDAAATGERAESASPNRSPSPQLQQGPPLHLRAPLQNGPPSEQLRLVKASNILSVDTKPWSPEGHVYEPEVAEDPLTGAMRVQLNQRIRFRVVDGPDGRPVRESNARFVRWSDGSLQLLLGDEVLDVAETDLDHRYMFLRHPGFIQAQAHLAKRMAFRPSSITSAAHKRLKQAVRKQHGVKGRTIKATVTMLDPVKEKAAQAKLEEQKNRDRTGLVKKQARMMRRYEPPPGAGAPRARPALAGGGLSARFLEGDDDDDADDEDAGGGDDDLARPHLGLQEEEAERRLASAKRSAPPPAAPARKRPRPGHEFDESDDEGGDGSGDEGFRSKVGRRAMALSDEDEDDGE